MVRVKQLDVSLGHPQDEVYEVDIEPIRQRGESRGSFQFWRNVVGGRTIIKTHQGERHALHIVRKIGYEKGKWRVRARRIRGRKFRLMTLCLAERRK